MAFGFRSIFMSGLRLSFLKSYSASNGYSSLMHRFGIVSISDWFTSKLTVSMSSGSSSSSSTRRRWWWTRRQQLQINKGRLQAAEASHGGCN